jgi:hypothetical protein
MKGGALMNFEHLNAVGEATEILYWYNHPDEKEEV